MPWKTLWLFISPLVVCISPARLQSFARASVATWNDIHDPNRHNGGIVPVSTFARGHWGARQRHNAAPWRLLCPLVLGSDERRQVNDCRPRRPTVDIWEAARGRARQNHRVVLDMPKAPARGTRKREEIVRSHWLNSLVAPATCVLRPGEPPKITQSSTWIDGSAFGR